MGNLKIGILLSDHVLDDLQEKHGNQDNFYRRIFQETNQDVTIDIYDVTQFTYPKSLNECDGYIITGSKLSVYDNERWIKELEKFVVDLFLNKRPLLGVCFGHHSQFFSSDPSENAVCGIILDFIFSLHF